MAKNAAHYQALGHADGTAPAGTPMNKPKSGWQLVAWQIGFDAGMAESGRTVTAKIAAAVAAPKLVKTYAYGHALSGNKHFERQMRIANALQAKHAHRAAVFAR